MGALGFSAGVFFAVYFIVIFGFSFVMYLLQAFAIYQMSKNMGFSNPWLAFIPIANTYAFGKVAETYVKPDGRPSAKFSKILLILQILLFIILIATIILIMVIAIMSNDAYSSVSEGIVLLVLPTVFLYFAMLGVAIAYSIIYYIALWRIFALYEYKNATLYLVLSIFISFLYPIFLFILRNKAPKFTMQDRLDIIQ